MKRNFVGKSQRKKAFCILSLKYEDESKNKLRNNVQNY